MRISNGITLTEGQGVAVSSNMVLTALHGSFDIGSPFTIIHFNDEKRNGFVFKVWFEALKEDIALIKLADDEIPFVQWLKVINRSPHMQESISILSIVSSLVGRPSFSAQKASVFCLDTGTSLCRAQYYAKDGLSGCGAIAEIQPNGELMVLGVHVATHDNTKKLLAIKKVKNSESAETESVSLSHESLSN